jgi:mannose-6-phosphate isomerase-like protein (cupin superfamily)
VKNLARYAQVLIFMKFHENIIQLTKENILFRKELVTGKHAQVVLMNVPPEAEIGEEVHSVDQILIFVEGAGEGMLDETKIAIKQGDLVFVPTGTKHNFRNTGTTPMKVATVYSPPEHHAGTTHKTKTEADTGKH